MQWANIKGYVAPKKYYVECKPHNGTNKRKGWFNVCIPVECSLQQNKENLGYIYRGNVVVIDNMTEEFVIHLSENDSDSSDSSKFRWLRWWNVIKQLFFFNLQQYFNRGCRPVINIVKF